MLPDKAMIERGVAEIRGQNRETSMKSLSEWDGVTVCMALREARKRLMAYISDS